MTLLRLAVHSKHQRLKVETDDKVKLVLSIALTNLQLIESNPQVRLHAVQLLGEYSSPEDMAATWSLIMSVIW